MKAKNSWSDASQNGYGMSYPVKSKSHIYKMGLLTE